MNHAWTEPPTATTDMLIGILQKKIKATQKTKTKSQSKFKANNRAPKGSSEALLKRQTNNQYRNYVKREKERGRKIEMTLDQFREMLKLPCHYCGRTPEEIKVKMTVDRADSDKGYSLDNCVPACHSCNIAKGTLTVDEFLSLCRAITRTHSARMP